MFLSTTVHSQYHYLLQLLQIYIIVLLKIQFLSTVVRVGDL